MAKINIPTEDGNVSLPEWASEATLRKILTQIKAGNVIDDEMLKAMGGMDEDVQDSFNKISRILRASTKSRQEDREAREDVKESLGSLSKDVGKVLNSDSLKGALKESAGVIWNRGIKPGTDKLGRQMGNYADKAGLSADAQARFGAAADTAGKALVAAAGAAYGMMPELQKSMMTMLDHGVLLNDMGDDIQTMVLKSAKAGLTFAEMSEVTAQYGSVIAGMSGDMANGVKITADLLGELNDATDAFGDFGTLTPELYSEFLSYVDAQRRSGLIKGNIEENKDALMASFIELKQNNSALAHVTGLKASEIMASKIALQSDPKSVAIDFMFQQRSPESIEAINSMQNSFASAQTMMKDSPELVNTMLAIYQDALEKANGDVAQIDMQAAAKRVAGPEMAGRLVETLNIFGDAVRNNTEVTDSFVADVIMNMEALDISAGSAESETYRYNELINQAKAQIQIYAGNLEKLKEIDPAGKEMQDMLKRSSSLTQASNALRESEKTVTGVMRQFSGSMAEIIGPSQQLLSDALIKIMGSDADEQANPINGETVDPRAQSGDWSGEFGGFPDEARAKGGPVRANKSYLVGEKGPEVFVPNSSGTVVNNTDFEKYQTLMANMFGGITTGFSSALGDISMDISAGNNVNNPSTTINASMPTETTSLNPTAVSGRSTTAYSEDYEQTEEMFTSMQNIIDYALQTKRDALQSIKLYEQNINTMVRKAEQKNRRKYID